MDSDLLSAVTDGDLQETDQIINSLQSLESLPYGFEILTIALRNKHTEIAKLLIRKDFDVTGSPLEYSFGKDSFNESAIIPKRYWLKEEDYHLPISLEDASSAINLCLENAKPDWKVSLLAVCDQKDKQQTVLLGTSIETDWHKTILVRIQEAKAISQITDCADILKEHLKMSPVKAHEVEINVYCTYILFGTTEAFTNWSEISKSNFEGYLSLELQWNTLSFYPPLRQSTKTLVMEIAAGWKGSPLDHLWEEILLLNRYLSILEAYLKKNLSSRYSVMPLKFPSSFFHPNIESTEQVMDNLNRLLAGDDTFLENRDTNSKKTLTSDDNVENDLKLTQHLQDLSSRQNLDFTDHLWMILKGSEDHDQVTDCVHTVFEEIEKKDFKPQMNVTNTTKLAKMISDINQQKATTPLLAGSLPLEILVDIGIEKLSRDYSYLLLSANLIDRHELQQKLKRVSSGELDLEKYKKNLLALAQIHICLEFAFLAQTHLDYPSGSLQSLFGCAFKKFTSEDSPVNSFGPLVENSVFSLNVPIPNAIIKQVIEGSPSSWYMRLSSNIGITQITSGIYYSLAPIFPPGIHCEDETNKVEETYNVASIVSSAYRIKK